jgi:hypothetical protein
MRLSPIQIVDIKLTDEACVGIKNRLQQDKALKLTLVNNSLAAAKVTELLSAPSLATNLNRVCIEKNPIELRGALAIVELLKKPALASLFLGSNNLPAEAVKLILQALKDNKTLKAIGIVDNKIGDAGAIEMAKVLESNSTLEQAYLGGNGITKIGATAIAIVLVKVNETLQILSLEDNNIDYPGVEMLAAAFMQSPSLTEPILMAGNPYGSEGEALNIALNIEKANLHAYIVRDGMEEALHDRDPAALTQVRQNLQVAQALAQLSHTMAVQKETTMTAAVTAATAPGAELSNPITEFTAAASSAPAATGIYTSAAELGSSIEDFHITDNGTVL